MNTPTSAPITLEVTLTGYDRMRAISSTAIDRPVQSGPITSSRPGTRTTVPARVATTPVKLISAVAAVAVESIKFEVN